MSVLLAQDGEQVAGVGGEPVRFAEPEGVGHGVACGADADGGVGVLDGLCGQDGQEVRDEGLELPAGEFVGLLVKTGELFAEGGFVEPAAEGPLGEAGLPGGLGDGGGEGKDGEDGLLAKGEGESSILRLSSDTSVESWRAGGLEFLRRLLLDIKHHVASVAVRIWPRLAAAGGPDSYYSTFELIVCQGRYFSRQRSRLDGLIFCRRGLGFPLSRE